MRALTFMPMTTNCPKSRMHLHTSVCISSYFVINSLPYTDWKSKSDECENVIDQLKEQNANVASTLAKLDRQVKIKVSFSNSCLLFCQDFFSELLSVTCLKFVRRLFVPFVCLNY